MKTKVLTVLIEKQIAQKGNKLLIALSGGPDSVCLLHLMNSLKQELDVELYAIHINHLLRNNESYEDEKYATELCNSLNIPLKVVRRNVKEFSENKKISIEEAARIVRYKEFYSYLEQISASYVLVAHNKNDQVETILLNLLRGSGIEGLKGMDYVNKHIARPLLGCSREEILDYLSKNNIPYRIDSSNLKPIYTRNRLRLELLPILTNIFGSSVIENILRMSEIIKVDANYLDIQTESEYKNNIIDETADYILINLKKIKNLHESIAKRIIRKAVEKLKGNLKDIEKINTDLAYNFIHKGVTGSQIDLPGNIYLYKSYDSIKFILKKPNKLLTNIKLLNNSNNQVIKKLNFNTETKIIEFGICIKVTIEKRIHDVLKYISESSDTLKFFDYDLVGEEIFIRNRMEKDTFKPLNSGHKSLKKYFIDSKVPKEIRNQIPLLAKGSEIIWIIGYNMNDNFKITQNTKYVMKIEIKKLTENNCDNN